MTIQAKGRIKSMEQRFYEALQADRGIRLTAAEVHDLIMGDGAFNTRIANRAARECAVPEGVFSVGYVEEISVKTWEGLKTWMKSEAGQRKEVLDAT